MFMDSLDRCSVRCTSTVNCNMNTMPAHTSCLCTTPLSWCAVAFVSATIVSSKSPKSLLVARLVVAQDTAYALASLVHKICEANPLNTNKKYSTYYTITVGKRNVDSEAHLARVEHFERFTHPSPRLERGAGRRDEGLEVSLEPGTSLRSGLKSIRLSSTVSLAVLISMNKTLTREQVES